MKITHAPGASSALLFSGNLIPNVAVSVSSSRLLDAPPVSVAACPHAKPRQFLPHSPPPLVGGALHVFCCASSTGPTFTGTSGAESRSSWIFMHPGATSFRPVAVVAGGVALASRFLQKRSTTLDQLSLRRTFMCVLDERASIVIDAEDPPRRQTVWGRCWRKRAGKGVEEMSSGVSRRTFTISLHALNWGCSANWRVV